MRHCFIYRKLDEKLTKLLSTTDKIVKAGIKQLAEKQKKLDIFDNQKIKNLKKRVIDLYYIDDEDELSQKMEMVCKEVIDLLIKYELCSIDDLDGTYFNKNKYLEMTNTANSLNDIIASSSIAQPYA